MFEHDGASDQPFSQTVDPRYLYRGESHGKAMELLQYSLEERESLLLLTGAAGTGKSMLCRGLIQQSEPKVMTAYVPAPCHSDDDLVRAVLRELGVMSRHEAASGAQAAEPELADLLEALESCLLMLRRLGARALLVVDDAQELPVPVLDRIRRLAYLAETHSLQIVLAGTADLVSRLERMELRSLKQCITVRCQLTPLSVRDVGGYVAHRLAVANGTPRVEFTPAAIEALHRGTGGVPREINRLCTSALAVAPPGPLVRIDGDRIEQVLANRIYT